MTITLDKVNEDKISFLKELDDGSVVFTCAHAEIEIPQDYIDKKIGEVQGSDVYLFALFKIKVYMTEDDYEKEKHEDFFFKYVTKIYTCPSQIVDGRDPNTGEKTLILRYQEGDSFIRNKNITVDSGVANTMLDLMTLGYFPNILPYDEIAKYWTDVSSYNGVSLSAMSQTSIELIVSELCRDNKKLSRPFRHKIRENAKTNPRSFAMINISQLPKYASAFAALTAGDPKGNLIAQIARQRSGDEKPPISPVEEVIL